jgi:hypothetical protein
MSVRALGPTAFYRAYLREIRVLPHDYLRSVPYVLVLAPSLIAWFSQFFRLKASDDLRAHREATCPSVRRTKDKRLTRVATQAIVWKRVSTQYTGPEETA